MAPRKTRIEAPLSNQICGAVIEVPGAAANAFCALPPDHDGDHSAIPPAPTRPTKPVAKTAPADSIEQAAEASALATQVFGDDLAKRPVIAKLARIMLNLPELKPLGKNEHFKYSFIKDTQISGAIRPRMAKENLMVIPEVLDEEWVETKTARGGISWVTKLKVRFTVIDADSGDSISGTGFGYGDDSGDKGANKAFTAAMKYWLIKLFQIGGEDDLENDTRTDERSAERQSGQAAAGPTNVTITGQNIEGVARGGQQDRISSAQLRAIGKLYTENQLTSEKFIEIIAFTLDDTVDVPEEAVPADVLNAYMKVLSGDKAGKLINALMEMKDDPSDGGGGYG